MLQQFKLEKIKLEQGELTLERSKKTSMDKTTQCHPHRSYEETELGVDKYASYFTL